MVVVGRPSLRERVHRARALGFGLLLALLAGCHGPVAPTASAERTTEHAEGPQRAANPAAATTPPLPTPEALFARLRDDFARCYAEGKNKAPSMEDGKVTWLVSVDAGGHVACVIPTDDTGLGQSTEDCMGARLQQEAFPAGAAGSLELPVRVDGGAMSLGQRRAGAGIETMEEHGLDDAMTTVQTLLPALQRCVEPVESRTMEVVHVGGRIGADGSVTCALATGSSAVPEAVRACTASTLAGAHFRAPKAGAGIVSIPIKVLR